MVTRWRSTARATMPGWVVLAMIVSAVPARADISLTATSEGIRKVTLIPPPGSESMVPVGVPVFGEVLFSSAPRPTGISYDSALEFRIASIPQGTVITSAIFTLTIAGAQGTGGSPFGSLDVRGYADADGVVALD